MATITNRLTKPAEKKPQGLVEYAVNGVNVTLSPAIVRQYLVNGDASKVTNQEVAMFIALCRHNGLDPFIRDAYLIKYGTAPATMVVGKDVFVKRAKKSPEFLGMQAGVIVEDKETGNFVEREGTFYQREAEELVGGWAKVFIKGYDVPFYQSVSLAEYIGRKKDGEVNGQWATKPATMIRKVALMQALREAFPEQNSGLYAPEEIQGDREIVLDDAPVVVEEEPAPAPAAAQAPAVAPVPVEPPKGESVADALFG